MPEESIFEDLPEGSENPEKPEGSELTPEEKKKKEDEIRQLTIANREEDKRLAKLREDLNKKRGEAKTIKKEIEGEEPEVVIPPEALIKKTVTETLQERERAERRRETIQRIRAVAKTKQEAERILEEADKFPDDWSAEDRVKFAAQRVQSLKEKSRGFVPPSVEAGSGFEDMGTVDTEEVPGMPKERVEALKKVGWSVEDIKKFMNGPDLNRAWGKGNPNF